jgi:hypothetical protein
MSLNYEYDFPDAASSVHPRETTEDKSVDSLWWDRAAEPGAYNIRGPNYLADKVKIPSKPSHMECLGCLFTFSRDPIKNVTSAPGHVVQEQHVGRADRPFLFVTNFIVPQIGNWVCYFARRRGQAEDPVFERMLKQFIEGTDEYRNARFKIIPGIPDGSWFVQTTVGNKPALLGNKLTTTYYKGDNFFEVEVDVGSSVMAIGILRVVAGYANSLDLELAFLFESQSDDELPERVLGGVRVRKPQLTPPWWDEVTLFG